jgi:hypothetical protein
VSLERRWTKYSKTLKLNKISYKNTIYIVFGTLIITVLLIAANGFNSTSSAQNSNICFACHEDHDLTMERDGKTISLYVNPKTYEKSVHGSAECTDCHVNYNPDEVPHTKTLQKVNCKSCHDDVKGLDKSVHVNVNCYDCHSKHEIIPAKEFAKEQTKACLKCHTGRNVQQFKTSAHAKKGLGCESCHKGGHNVTAVTKSEIPGICGKCHTSHEKSFNNSVHETVFKSGNKNAPSCVDCHGEHKIISSKMSIESQSCLKCHLDKKLFPGNEVGSAEFVEKYKTSIHSSIEKNGQEAAGCVDCHGNHMIQSPENPSATINKMQLPKTCGKCHKDVEEKFLSSAHGKALLNKSVAAPTCITCHKEHSIEAVSQSSEFSKINQVEMCLKCHIGGTLPQKNYKGEKVPITDYKNSFHYMALKNGNENAATCSDCHGAHQMKKYDDPTSKIYKKNIASTCGQSDCHTKELAEYTGSIHEVALMTKNAMDAPTCTTCHGNHQILQKTAKNNRLSNPKGLVQLCSDCHASVQLVKKYDLPVGRTETYLKSYHGLAIQGGSEVAAKCESCHGNHNIRPSSDTLSTINKRNLPVTCGKCHPGAETAFLNAPIHITNASTQTPALYWITIFYIVMIVTVIGGMVLHNAFDFFKKFRLRK